MIVALVISITQIATATTSAFYYKSGAAGSYVAANGSDSITGGQGNWVLSTPLDQPSDGSIIIRMVEGNYDQWWFIHLAAPQGQSLTTDIYQANRWPFQSADKVGFDWDGNGRGLNMSTTYLEIVDFHQDPITKIVDTLRFNALQFEEVEGTTNLNFDLNRCSFLSFNYNSSDGISESPSAALLAMTVPEPSGWLLAGIGACITFIKRQR